MKRRLESVTMEEKKVSSRRSESERWQGVEMRLSWVDMVGLEDSKKWKIFQISNGDFQLVARVVNWWWDESLKETCRVRARKLSNLTKILPQCEWRERIEMPKWKQTKNFQIWTNMMKNTRILYGRRDNDRESGSLNIDDISKHDWGRVSKNSNVF